MEITREPLHLDTRGGRGRYEHVYTLRAWEGDTLLGLIDFRVLESTHHEQLRVSMIEVRERQRTGIATKLMDRLVAWVEQHPEIKAVHIGLVTDDGARFFRRYFERRTDLRGARYRGARRAVGLTW